MSTNVNLEAAAGVLAFLGTGFVVFLLAAVIAHAFWRRKLRRAKIASVAAVVVVTAYVCALFLFSLASTERVLARGEEKYFCEIDYHLAYSVVDVTKAKTLGGAGGQATAKGTFYVVTLRTRFDEQTTSARRGDALLWPNPRRAAIQDEQGTQYQISTEGQRALEAAGEGGTPLTTPLKPGESYATRLVFDLPEDAGDPALLLNETMLPTHFIIGHENSPLHRQAKFHLTAQAS